MILLDTSGLLAVVDRGQRLHAACAAALRASTPPRLVSPFALAELDYLLGRRVDERARIELLAEVGRGAYALPPLSSGDVAAAQAVVEHYADLRVSLADASIVVLSERLEVRDVLTLDERHFRILRGAHGLPFRVLPADA